jgi:hypothetical protein
MKMLSLIFDWFKNKTALFRIQNPPLSRRQTAKPEIANPHAQQPQRRMVAAKNGGRLASLS